MACALDPVNIVNVLLCAAIVMLGYWGYKRGGSGVPFAIGIAFGIFGLSHIITMMGLRGTLTNFLIIIRVLAYLIVILALYKIAIRGKAQQ